MCAKGRPPLPRSEGPSPVAGARWVPLPHARFALVDAEDYDRVCALTWSLTRKGYVVANTSEREHVYLHRFVLGDALAPDVEVDHIFGNKLDNRKQNLRAATRSENQRNRPAPRHNTSGHKGVSRHRQTGRWRAEIQVDKKRRHLGLFDTPEEAAAAYAEAARAAGEHGAVRTYGDLASTPPEAP